MEKYKALLIVSALFTIFYPITTQVCNPNKNYGVQIGLNKCFSNQVKLNNTCLNCKVQNCLLCSLFNQNQCDVCKKGYILDKLTTSVCLPLANNALTCKSSSCSCILPLVNDNGRCRICQASHCSLCSVGNPTQCDVCYPNYQLDPYTGYVCVKSIQLHKLDNSRAIDFLIIFFCLILIAFLIEICEKFIQKKYKERMLQQEIDRMDKIPSTARPMRNSMQS